MQTARSCQQRGPQAHQRKRQYWNRPTTEEKKQNIKEDKSHLANPDHSYLTQSKVAGYLLSWSFHINSQCLDITLLQSEKIKAKCLGHVDKLLIIAIILEKYKADQKEDINQRRVYTILNAFIFSILKFKLYNI